MNKFGEGLILAFFTLLTLVMVTLVMIAALANLLVWVLASLLHLGNGIH